MAAPPIDTCISGRAITVRNISARGFSTLLIPEDISLREREISDHFDGERYLNPTFPEKLPSITTLVRDAIFKYRKKSILPPMESVMIPRWHERLEEGDAAITLVHGATFLVQVPGANILTDPLWPAPVRAYAPQHRKVTGIHARGADFDDLPFIDIVVVSHNHHGHLDVETLKRLSRRHAPTILVPIGDARRLQLHGIDNVHEMDWWDRFWLNLDLQITFTPAQHGSAIGWFDRNRSLWGSYLIRHKNKRIYFGGDSGYSTHYSEIRKRLGSPDIALLGVNAPESGQLPRPMTMRATEAVRAHEDLGARRSVGLHCGTPHDADRLRWDLCAAVAQAGLPPSHFRTLATGETRFYREPERWDGN